MLLTKQVEAWNRWYARGVDAESQSGVGSSLENTKEIRAALPDIFLRHGVRTLVDVPCGDWHWMRHVDLSTLHYRGFDAVESVVQRNVQEFGGVNVEFAVLDAVRQKPPRCDLILCRDFLFHLPNNAALRVLKNFRTSRSRLLLTTTFPKHAVNADIPDADWIGWRKLNLEAPPFNLPPPLEVVQENDSPACLGRVLGLFLISEMR